MQKTTTYCDVCGDVTPSGYAIDFKWCNDREYNRFDICKSCYYEAKSFVTDKEEQDYKNESSKLLQLGFLRMFSKKKKLK